MPPSHSSQAASLSIDPLFLSKQALWLVIIILGHLILVTRSIMPFMASCCLFVSCLSTSASTVVHQEHSEMIRSGGENAVSHFTLI